LNADVHFLPMPEDTSVYAPPEVEELANKPADENFHLPESPIALSFREVLGASWSFAKANFGKFFGYGACMFVVFVLVGLLSGVVQAGFSSAGNVPMQITGQVIGQLISTIPQIFFSTGFIFALLKLTKTGTMAFEDFFQFSTRAFGKMLAIQVMVFVAFMVIFGGLFMVYMLVPPLSETIDAYLSTQIPTTYVLLAVMFGVLGLIGLIFAYPAVRLMYVNFTIVDQNMGVFESIKYSWRLTKGNFWSFVGIYLVLYLIMLISAIPFGIGLILTIPMLYASMGVCYVYLHTGRTVLPR